MYYYYKKCWNFIAACKDAGELYAGLRAILREADERGKYPEDWHIRALQRAADHKYEQLTEG